MSGLGRRTLVVLALLLGLADRLRRHAASRPEPLPAVQDGAAVVRTRDGLALHVQVGGDPQADTTVVLVHGFLARSLEWDMQWAHLCRTGVRVVRYDHRLHGRSEGSSRTVGIEDLAADLAAVVDQVVPVGRVVLVGHSMGGMTVLALVRLRPDLLARVAGIGLVSTGAGHYLPGHPVENAGRWASRRHLLVAPLLLFRLLAPVLEPLRVRRTGLARRAVRVVMFGKADVDPATLSMTQSLLQEPTLRTFGALQGTLLRHEARAALDDLRRSGTPVAVITGSDDVLTRPGHSRLMAEQLGPTAALTVVAGAGHVVNQTRPVEVNAALDDLLRRVRSAERAA